MFPSFISCNYWALAFYSTHWCECCESQELREIRGTSRNNWIDRNKHDDGMIKYHGNKIKSSIICLGSQSFWPLRIGKLFNNHPWLLIRYKSSFTHFLSNFSLTKHTPSSYFQVEDVQWISVRRGNMKYKKKKG